MEFFSVSRQMAFYLEVEEADLEFPDSMYGQGSCTVCAKGVWYDVFFDPHDSMVHNYWPA
jgi:hypothetical protein